MTREDDVELLRRAIPLWRTMRDWAEELLCATLGLARARDALALAPRGPLPIPGTEWRYRIHETGVDIDRGPGCGGIDFEFDRTRPDEGQLRSFVQRQVKAGELSADYGELAGDEARFARAARALLATDTAMHR